MPITVRVLAARLATDTHAQPRSTGYCAVSTWPTSCAQGGDLATDAREALHHHDVAEHIAGALGDLLVQLLHPALRVCRCAAPRSC